MNSKNGQEATTDLQEIRLRGGHVVEVASSDDSTMLRVRNAGSRDSLEIEVAWSAQGPVARVRAARIDLQTTADVSVHCKSFAVETSEGISLRAQGNVAASGATVEVEARQGRFVARANDDVQLLGEQVLLNCDRAPGIPDWAKQGPGVVEKQLLALPEESGDQDLIATIREDEDKSDGPR